jgi:hypothetical protein
MAAMVGMLMPDSVQAAKPLSGNETGTTKLSSIAKLSVTREDIFDVPGGKEYFYDWQASDENGVTKKFAAHGSRIDSESSYTITLDATVQKFAAGADIEAPTTTTQQRITIFGIKGEIVGSVRNDRVIFTTVHADGSSAREERMVPVRLDLSEFAQQDFATIATNAGKLSLAKNR